MKLIQTHLSFRYTEANKTSCQAAHPSAIGISRAWTVFVLATFLCSVTKMLDRNKEGKVYPDLQFQGLRQS